VQIRPRVRSLLLAGVLAGFGCGSDNVSPKLEQAVDAVRYMTSPRQLSRSAVSVVQEQGTPSELVAFLFSTMGSAEWPLALDDAEAAAMRSAFIPVLPRSVLVDALRPEGPWPQLVLQADDARGMLIAVGYEAPGRPPVLSEEWPLPEISPDPRARELIADRVR
jgi:hypothetical protein